MSKRNWIYGRNVVLTGCSTGMGKEVLMLLVKKYGCNVMGVARNKAKLDELKAELGDKFSYRRFNISSQEEWRAFAKELEDMGFMTDILINNAGMIQPFGAFDNLDDAMLDKIINTNLMSVIYGCQAMIPTIKKSRFGGIVNVASASAILPFGGQSIYSATKGGVWGFTNALAQELRGYGVSVTCVMPGPVKTDLYKAREGESSNKADSLVESVGITALTAAKRIVRAMRCRKIRCVTDFVAHAMSLGMKVMPASTVKMAGGIMKTASKKLMPSFAPIYQDQFDNADMLKERIKGRKANTYNKLSEVPPTGPFGEDMGK
ncbi:MAG: SDR family NAD(P)-dependent oxidoreductase [Christensenellales bacterium]